MSETVSIPEITVTDKELFGKKPGLFSRFFGCGHSRMSRPVTTGSRTYKYCSTCGIRRQFDPITYKPIGQYYYPQPDLDLHQI